VEVGAASPTHCGDPLLSRARLILWITRAPPPGRLASSAPSGGDPCCDGYAEERCARRVRRAAVFGTGCGKRYKFLVLLDMRMPVMELGQRAAKLVGSAIRSAFARDRA
jgi:hypothetical protein